MPDIFRWRGLLLASAGLATVAAPIVVAAAEPIPRAGQSASGGTNPLPEDVLYRPSDADERGLWQMMDEEERNLRVSPSVIRDPALNSYIRGILCRTVNNDKCRNVRLYIMRTPQFNATMAPNGMMQVWSGLLLRAQNEAQLAAVLGHEYSHFERRHTLKLWRQVREKTNAAS